MSAPHTHPESGDRFPAPLHPAGIIRHSSAIRS